MDSWHVFLLWLVVMIVALVVSIVAGCVDVLTVPRRVTAALALGCLALGVWAGAQLIVLHA